MSDDPAPTPPVSNAAAASLFCLIGAVPTVVIWYGSRGTDIEWIPKACGIAGGLLLVATPLLALVGIVDVATGPRPAKKGLGFAITALALLALGGAGALLALFR